MLPQQLDPKRRGARRHCRQHHDARGQSPLAIEWISKEDLLYKFLDLGFLCQVYKLLVQGFMSSAKLGTKKSSAGAGTPPVDYTDMNA